jgi:hypothetical protein
MGRMQPTDATASMPTPTTVRTARRDSSARVLSVILFCFSAGLLGLAAWLEPAGNGVGTHEKLGLPQCGFLKSTGIPCGTCGMTTSFSHAANGDLWASFTTQPAGMVLALFTAVVLVLSTYGLVTGVSLGPIFDRIWRPWTFIGFGLFFLAAWGYKILAVKGMI